MTLSILCVTMAEPHALRFIEQMKALSVRLSAEFVLGLDGPLAPITVLRNYADVAVDTPPHDALPIQEAVSDWCVQCCTGDWVLRLDDDEAVSPALEAWLQTKAYESSKENFTFPRVYLYPDARHYLINPGMFPDMQTRLGLRDNMMGVSYIHAPNPHGTGPYIPAAIEHHKLLVRDRAARDSIAARYESIRAGAGSLPEYARYNLPEMFYSELEYKDYSDGDFTAP